VTTHVELELKSKVEVTVEVLAQCFCALTDDEMCKFFVEVARLADEWRNSADTQWYYLGGHLRNCACSTEGAREMIRQIAYQMEHSEHR
jgi:hypothetical protein